MNKLLIVFTSADINSNRLFSGSEWNVFWEFTSEDNEDNQIIRIYENGEHVKSFSDRIPKRRIVFINGEANNSPFQDALESVNRLISNHNSDDTIYIAYHDHNNYEDFLEDFCKPERFIRMSKYSLSSSPFNKNIFEPITIENMRGGRSINPSVFKEFTKLINIFFPLSQLRLYLLGKLIPDVFEISSINLIDEDNKYRYIEKIFENKNKKYYSEKLKVIQYVFSEFENQKPSFNSQQKQSFEICKHLVGIETTTHNYPQIKEYFDQLDNAISDENTQQFKDNTSFKSDWKIMLNGDILIIPTLSKWLCVLSENLKELNKIE